MLQKYLRDLIAAKKIRAQSMVNNSNTNNILYYKNSNNISSKPAVQS